jgi:hypothetical protein
MRKRRTGALGAASGVPERRSTPAEWLVKAGATVLVLVILSIRVLAQQSAGLPELKALERYIGTWVYEGEDRTPGGGRVQCTSLRQWTGAGFFVESHRRCMTPRGDLQQVEVYGYDYSERVYRYWGFNGQFVSGYTTPTIDEAPIRWASIAFPRRYRCTEAFDPGGASSTSRCETSSDGATWTVISQGQSKRTSP